MVHWTEQKRCGRCIGKCLQKQITYTNTAVEERISFEIRRKKKHNMLAIYDTMQCNAYSLNIEHADKINKQTKNKFERRIRSNARIQWYSSHIHYRTVTDTQKECVYGTTNSHIDGAYRIQHKPNSTRDELALMKLKLTTHTGRCMNVDTFFFTSVCRIECEKKRKRKTKPKTFAWGAFFSNEIHKIIWEIQPIIKWYFPLVRLVFVEYPWVILTFLKANKEN